MKIKSKLILLGAIALASVSFTSCNDDDNDKILTSSFQLPGNLEYTSDGYWKDCYNKSYNTTGIEFPPFVFSHNAEITEWEGVEYKSWYGFCPSKCSDQGDYTDTDNWTEHQWATSSIYNNRPYLVACWDVREPYNNPLLAKSCVIKPADNKTFAPIIISLSNNTYGYYAMRNGTAFNAPFGKNDYTFVRVYGMLQNIPVGYIDVYLAKDGEIAESWLNVDLSSFGYVDSLIFTMDSSQKSSYGMNVPAYFCLRDIIYQANPEK